MHLSIQVVTQVSADIARGESTGNFKSKMFCAHICFEALFTCGVKFKCNWVTWTEDLFVSCANHSLQLCGIYSFGINPT